MSLGQILKERIAVEVKKKTNNFKYSRRIFYELRKSVIYDITIVGN